jgi:DNA repair exonuclease SbcCD ATPase subunit
MSDHPRMLYRKGGKDSPEYHGLRCDIRIADDRDEELSLANEGWRRSPAAAYGEPEQADTPTAETDDERQGLLQEIEDLRKQLAEKPTDEAVADLYKEMDELRARAAAAEKERDETRELLAAFDRDNDGKPGGSQPKPKKASAG